MDIFSTIKKCTKRKINKGFIFKVLGKKISRFIVKTVPSPSVCLTYVHNLMLKCTGFESCKQLTLWAAIEVRANKK